MPVKPIVNRRSMKRSSVSLDRQQRTTYESTEAAQAPGRYGDVASAASRRCAPPHQARGQESK
jgi:hypothetical protein